jgi:hypothetical protein
LRPDPSDGLTGVFSRNLKETSCQIIRIFTIPHANGQGRHNVSGKPNLHVPARMGILSSARFPMHSLLSDDLKLLQQSDISSIIPINTYVDSGHRYQFNHMLHHLQASCTSPSVFFVRNRQSRKP